MYIFKNKTYYAIVVFYILIGIISSTMIYDYLDINFASPKEKIQSKELILFTYKTQDGNFTLFPLGSDNETYQLPVNTKLNMSVIRLPQYDNYSFVNLTIPNGMSYDYLRGFISMSENSTLVLSWRKDIPSNEGSCGLDLN